MFKIKKQTKKKQNEEVISFIPFNNLVAASMSEFPHYIATEVIEYQQ